MLVVGRIYINVVKMFVLKEDHHGDHDLGTLVYIWFRVTFYHTFMYHHTHYMDNVTVSHGRSTSEVTTKERNTKLYNACSATLCFAYTKLPILRRLLGPSVGRWEDNIRMDLKEIGINMRNWV